MKAIERVILALFAVLVVLFVFTCVRDQSMAERETRGIIEGDAR